MAIPIIPSDPYEYSLENPFGVLDYRQRQFPNPLVLGSNTYEYISINTHPDLVDTSISYLKEENIITIFNDSGLIYDSNINFNYHKIANNIY